MLKQAKLTSQSFCLGKPVCKRGFVSSRVKVSVTLFDFIRWVENYFNGIQSYFNIDDNLARDT